MIGVFREALANVVNQQTRTMVQVLANKYGFNADEAYAFLTEPGLASDPVPDPVPDPAPEQITIKKKRKNVETPWTEYVAAVIFQHPSATYEQLETLPITLPETLATAYKKDIAQRPTKTVEQWFDTCKNQSQSWRNQCAIGDNDQVEVFLTGKKVKDERVLDLLKNIKDKKQHKADIFLCINKARWIGISVKTTKGDPLSNWSIEKLIKETSPDVAETLKTQKTTLLNNNGIDRKWRANKEENRAKYNAIMHGSNVYKQTLHEWLTEHADSTLKNIVASIAGSPITDFINYKYDGTTFENLHQIHETITSSDMLMLADIPETKKQLETLGLKQHYSNNAAKLWYYVKVGSSFKYRFEIRWKGDPFASPQLMLYSL